MAVTAGQVRGFAAYVDSRRNGGNQNGYVDGGEIELFKKKCKTAGLDTIDEIIEGYQKNKYKKEAEYEANGTTGSSDVDAAVIAALTEKTGLKINEKASAEASTIIEGLKDESGWWNNLWGNDSDLKVYSDMIDKDNVLEVVSDDDAIDALDEGSDEAKDSVILHLCTSAKEHGIDVSNLVLERDGELCVGRDVEDADFGERITEDSNFTAVVKALREALEEAKDTATGSGNKHEMLTSMAERIDADGNGNGYIDTAEEVQAFKQFAASYDIDVDAILEEIRDNEANGVENTTEAQKTIFNIFDPNRKAEIDKKFDGNAADAAKALEVGLKEDDEELIKWGVSQINSDNIMQILENDPEIAEKLADEYDFTWKFWRRDSYQDYTTPILNALIQHANECGVAIDDIVTLSGDELIVGSAVEGADIGDDAYDSDNVGKVVKAIQERIKSVIQ